MVKGRFIVLDGIDGGGKSTQANLIKDFFENQGQKVLLTHEPNSKTKTGRLLKKLVKNSTQKISKEKWISLFSKQRKENLRLIKNELKNGKIVICDRYYYSTLAYQLDKKEWKDYLKNFMKPDLTFILDVPLKISMKRIEKKNKEQKIKRAIFENETFLKEVKRKFLNMKNFNEVKIINGNKNEKEVFKIILKEIKKW